ncbi:MAG: RCC1 domain-containing protein [Polyangiales bacterium]
MRRDASWLVLTAILTCACSSEDASPSSPSGEDSGVEGSDSSTTIDSGASSEDSTTPEDTGVSTPKDGAIDAPVDTGPTCGAPGLACCDGSDAGGCSEYLTCAATDAGPSTCGGCIAGLTSKFEYSCARRNDGSAWCWGYVWGPKKLFTDPVEIGDFTKVTSVSVGDDHGCLVDDGKVQCWGSNAFSQMGTGVAGDSYSWFSPTLVTLASSATKVTSGASFNCALLTDGSVSCFGLNGVGQLGNGTKTWPALPSRVVGLPAKVLDVVAGSSAACAYLEDDSVWCWGDNLPGITQTATPLKVGTVAKVVRMALRDSLYLVTESGGVMQLSAASTLSPVTEFGADVVQISMGQYHTCALRRDGSVGCKGNNSSGQLADGSITNSTKVVESWKLGKNNVEVMCGRYLTCARDRFGAVTCFGTQSASTTAGRLKIACP